MSTFKELYNKEIADSLMKKFNYSSITNMQMNNEEC